MRHGSVRDFVLSLAGLVFLSPLMAAVALVIWVDSPGAGPVFVQRRVGLHGKTFSLLKFRTMCAGAEEELAGLLDQNEMNGPVFKMRHDPRITRVGRFLRRSGLDELPQLINVLAGDMSLVGPRPRCPGKWSGMALMSASACACCLGSHAIGRSSQTAMKWRFRTGWSWTCATSGREA